MGFGIRTPTKKRSANISTESVEEMEKAGPSRTPEPNVLPSTGKPEAREAELQAICQTPVKEQRNAMEVTESSPKQNHKYLDRLAEAKNCVTKAKINLSNSRNIKTEIKNEVISAVDRLYQLVKEGETVKGKTKKVESEKVNKMQTEEVTKKGGGKGEKDLIDKMEAHAKLIRENNDKMEKLKETIEKQQEALERQTYASVAAAPNRQTRGQTALHSVVVTAKDETETGEEVLNRIRKAVNAKESGISVEKIRKAKDRKVIVGCRTEEERDKVKAKLRGATELNVEEVKNKDPLVILKDVLKYNTDEDVLSSLVNQNKAIVGNTKGLKMEIAYKKNTRNPHTHHIVLRVSPKIWQCLVDAETVLIDLQRVRVADQSPLVQCSLCLGYGHGRRFCKETTEKCSHCSGPHLKTECAEWTAGAVPTCINCVHAKVEKSDHNAFSGECPIRRRWDALARASIAYC